MSYQSTGPDVYQYAPQSQTSFNTSPFLIKPINHSIDIPPPTYHSHLPTTYTGLGFRPNSSIPSNNYQPIIPPPTSIRPSLGSEAVTYPLHQNAYPKPEVKVENKLQAIQSTSSQQVGESTEDRYEDYLEHRVEEYKYNIFSFADQPWNRCINGDGCAKLPGNQCIARSNPRKYWD